VECDPRAPPVGAGPRAHPLLGLPATLLQEVLDDLGQQRLLGGEMGVEAARRQAGLAHDAVDAAGVVAAFPKDLAGGGQDAGVRLLLVAGSEAHDRLRGRAEGGEERSISGLSLFYPIE